MFKSLRGGLRRSGSGGSRPGRVSATRMGNTANLDSQVLRRPAFMSPVAQDSTFDSKSKRLSGLEKN